MSAESLSPLTLQASALIEERTGLAIHALFSSDLNALFHDLAGGDMALYVEKLRSSNENTPIWQALINTLTIGETYFMRGKTHFNLLKKRLLPELMLRNRREFKVWSVGCATGEEPYSVAITLLESLPRLSEWSVSIIGTDVNARSLEIARNGLYRQWAFRHVDNTFKQRYFDEYGESVRIKSNIREMVSFRLGNLLEGPPMPQPNVIFCRNVLLYFGINSTERVEDMLFNALAPGGWLILGQAEAIHVKRERWITHIFPGAAIYQKPANALSLRAGETAYNNRSIGHKLEKTLPPPADTTLTTYEDAVNALQDDRPEDAKRHLADLLSLHPHHARAHMLLAGIFANRQALPEARAHLDASLRSDPLLADAHYLKAVLYLENGEMEEARKALHAALYCQSTHPMANFMLGNLYMQTGDMSKAHHAWSNASEAVANLKEDEPISDLDDMTAGHFSALVNEQLAGLE